MATNPFPPLADPEEAAFVRQTAEAARQVIVRAAEARTESTHDRLRLCDAIVGHLAASFLAARAHTIERADSAVSQFTLFLRQQVPAFLRGRHV